MSSITDQLRQREFWTDADGQAHLLTEMEPGHRANLLRYLQRNATDLAHARAREIYPRQAGIIGGLDYHLTAITPELAERWLAHQPLVRRLVELRREDLTRTRNMVHRSPLSGPDTDADGRTFDEIPRSELDGILGANAHGDAVTPEWEQALDAIYAAALRFQRATGEKFVPELIAGELAKVTRERDGILRDIKDVRQTVKDLRKELSVQRQENLRLQVKLDKAAKALRDVGSGQYHLHILLPGEAQAPAGSAGAGTYFQVGQPFSWEDPRTKIRVSGSPSAKAAYEEGTKHMVRRPTSTDELDDILFGTSRLDSPSDYKRF